MPLWYIPGAYTELAPTVYRDVQVRKATLV